MELMDTTPDPPHTVRIKRKRDEAPLSALFMEERKQTKKTKTNAYVFKLAGTFEQEPINKGTSNILLESTPNKSRKIFKLPSRKSTTVPHEDPEIAQSLTDMVQNYLEVEHNQQTVKFTDEKPVQQQKAGSVLPDTTTSADAEIEDYVYDIYYREKISNFANPDEISAGSNVGLIMIDSDDDLLANNDDSDFHASDDEDSNAEDFYKNDYPDEDDGDSSDFFDSEDEFRDQELPEEIREGRYYMGNLRNQDDEDDFNDEDSDEYSENSHSPRKFEAQWSEDEDLEQYRDRIFSNFERRLNQHS